MNMKILWISDYAQFKGGAEAYIFDMVETLASHDHYLLYKFDEVVSSDFCTGLLGAFPLVEFESQIAEIKPDIIYIQNIQDENIQALCSKLDIPIFRFIHDHKLFCPREHKYTFLNSKTCKKKYGAGCIFCCGFFNKQKKRIVTPRELDQRNKEVMKNDKIIVSSEYMRKQLLSYGHSLDKISKISLYSRFEKNNSKVEKAIDVLYFGSLLKGKGVPVLLRALEMSVVKLKVTLITADENLQDLKVSNPKVELTVINDVKRDQLAEYILKSKLVVVPSLSPETFSLAGIEALSLGVRVVASRVGGIEEWSGNDGVTLFESGNYKELINRIEWHIANECPKPIAPILFTKKNHALLLERVLLEEL
jgi:glycosyltransferase involved in cell wall biosynthesis